MSRSPTSLQQLIAIFDGRTFDGQTVPMKVLVYIDAYKQQLERTEAEMAPTDRGTSLEQLTHLFGDLQFDGEYVPYPIVKQIHLFKVEMEEEEAYRKNICELVADVFNENVRYASVGGSTRWLFPDRYFELEFCSDCGDILRPFRSWNNLLIITDHMPLCKCEDDNETPTPAVQPPPTRRKRKRHGRHRRFKR